MGSLYKQSGSSIWWVKYYSHGRPVRESTGTTDEQEAKQFLKKQEGQVAAGQPLLLRLDRIRYEEVVKDLQGHYEATGTRDLKEFHRRVKHLDRFFGGWHIATIGQPDVDAYVVARRRKGAAGGTIRRELGTLTKMLRLAYQNGKLARLPLFQKPKEAAPRGGFFEWPQYEAVRRQLERDLQVAVTIAYTFGWRMQSEVLALERRHLDLEAGTLRLDPGMAKNEEGRLVYLTPELRTLLVDQLERIKDLEKSREEIVRWLFPHRGPRLAGKRIRDFRKAWVEACKAAGVPGAYRHDFRRTAVRNLVNAGVPERVAMKITGHKTRSVFDRYHIVSPGDLQEASRKLAGQSPAALAGHSFGHSRTDSVDGRQITS
jgi:integrase